MYKPEGNGNTGNQAAELITNFGRGFIVLTPHYGGKKGRNYFLRMC
jgi:hypothetical protein